MAYSHGKFVPEIDLKENLEKISEDDQLNLYIRAEVLTGHAIENSLYNVSESTWESDLRSDLFGRIREDRNLRM